MRTLAVRATALFWAIVAAAVLVPGLVAAQTPGPEGPRGERGPEGAPGPQGAPGDSGTLILGLDPLLAILIFVIVAVLLVVAISALARPMGGHGHVEHH